MSLQPSLRRRGVVRQSVRLSQPAPWTSAMGNKFLLMNNSGFAMTASATANTPGAWVQYIPAANIPATETIHSLHIQAVGNNQVPGADNSMLLDIAKGAAGSEVIVAEDIAVGGAANSGGAGPVLHIPVRIEGATRVACRVRSATGSRVLTMQQIAAFGASSAQPFAYRLPLAVDVIGSSKSTSTGTAMAGASGSWTEITASTTRDYQSLVIVPSIIGGFTGATTTIVNLDLGLGQSGQESIVAHSMSFYNANGVMFPYGLLTPNTIYGGFVPAGTRIAVRHNLASNPGRVGACVIGVPYA